MTRRETDRQTDGETDRQTDRQIESETQRERETDRQTDRQTDGDRLKKRGSMKLLLSSSLFYSYTALISDKVRLETFLDINFFEKALKNVE